MDASIKGGGGSSQQPPASEARRKRGRPRDPEADSRILAAASSLILRLGFDNMTVDEVASTAGVGKATVYRRWPRKEDLAVAAMERLYHDEMPTADTGSIRGDLREMYASALRFINSATGTDYVRTAIKEPVRDPRIASLYLEASTRAERSAAVVFERAKARGEVRADMPMGAALQLMSSLIANRAITGHPMPSIDELDELVAFTLTGIQA